MSNRDYEAEKRAKVLDSIFIVITFALFLTLGGIVLFFTFSSLSVFVDDATAPKVVAVSYVAAILLSVILGMIAIGTTTYNRYPETCAVVCALGGVFLLGRLFSGGLVTYQVVALVVGASCCFFGAFRYATAKKFLK